MHKLTKISRSLLRDGERLELLAHLITVLENCEIDDIYLTSLTASFIQDEKDLKEAVKREQASELTAQINSLDNKRGDLLSSLRGGIRYFMDKANDDQSAAAKRLKVIYDESVKGLNLNSNSEESVGISNILTASEEPTVQADLALLLLTEDISSLKATQDLFASTTADRALIEESDNSPRLIPTRKSLHSNTTTLREILHFQSRNNSEPYRELITQLNGRINEIVTVAKSRETSEKLAV